MARRPLRPEEARLWALVARTVKRSPHAAEPPTPADHVPVVTASPSAAVTPVSPPARPVATPEALAALAQAGVGREARFAERRGTPQAALAPIEPNRRRRIARAREPIGGRLDLHGHDQDRARSALHAFIVDAQVHGARAVLVITGKGETRGGVLRVRVPEWLTEPPSRSVVAGVSPAEPRHGGAGALYVALKRKPDSA